MVYGQANLFSDGCSLILFECLPFSSIRFIDLDLKSSKHIAFLKRLKQKLETKQLLLTMTVLTNKEHIEKEFDYSAISENLDFINFEFLIDFWSQSRNIQNSEYAIDQTMKLGVPSTKILTTTNLGGTSKLGFLTTYRHVSSSEFHHSDIIDSGEICWKSHIYCNNFTYDSDLGVGVITNYARESRFLIESSRVIANKIRFAMRNNLAGAVISDTSADDHRNQCASIDHHTYDDYKSLVPGVTLRIPKRTGQRPFYANVLNEAIFVALDEISQETQLLAKNNDSVNKREKVVNTRPVASRDAQEELSFKNLFLRYV